MKHPRKFVVQLVRPSGNSLLEVFAYNADEALGKAIRSLLTETTGLRLDGFTVGSQPSVTSHLG